MRPILIAILAMVIPLSATKISVNVNQSSIASPSCNAYGSVCADDCKSILQCINGEVITFKCSDLSIQFPYCTPNTYGCTSQRDLQYTACALLEFVRPEFICTGDGYFPSTDDCTKFIICNAYVAYEYQCPPNYVYDASKNECKLREKYTDCITVQCLTENGFTVHRGNRSFYGFCSVVDCTTQIIMFRCANGHIFNLDKLKCEFECLFEGRFPVDTNCQEFYECYRAEDTDQLRPQLVSCPNSYIFDSIARICVPGTCEN